MSSSIKWIKKPTDRYFTVNDGRTFDFCSFDTKVNLQAGLMVSIAERNEYAKCSWPTINELVDRGEIMETFPYREYTICPKGEFYLHEIIKEFADNGFEVSKQAIVHNYNAWLMDYKSGYRGRKSHLFTPCGCNPLSFTATTLHPSCKEWQTTYEC